MKWQIKRITGKPYNARGQGIVEQDHQILKLQLLKIKRGESPKNVLALTLFSSSGFFFCHKELSLGHPVPPLTHCPHVELWHPVWYKQLRSWQAGKMIWVAKGYALVIADGSSTEMWVPFQCIRPRDDINAGSEASPRKNRKCIDHINLRITFLPGAR